MAPLEVVTCLALLEEPMAFGTVEDLALMTGPGLELLLVGSALALVGARTLLAPSIEPLGMPLALMVTRALEAAAAEKVPLLSSVFEEDGTEHVTRRMSSMGTLGCGLLGDFVADAVGGPPPQAPCEPTVKPRSSVGSLLLARGRANIAPDVADLADVADGADVAGEIGAPGA